MLISICQLDNLLLYIKWQGKSMLQPCFLDNGYKMLKCSLFCIITYKSEYCCLVCICDTIQSGKVPSSNGSLCLECDWYATNLPFSLISIHHALYIGRFYRTHSNMDFRQREGMLSRPAH